MVEALIGVFGKIFVKILEKLPFQRKNAPPKRTLRLAFHKLCRKAFPGCGFKGEEFPYLNIESRNGYTWHIDPIDGTKNFAHEVPIWSVTVSLVKDGQPVFGVIYNPVSKQLYTATEGRGAYLNGLRLVYNASEDPAKIQLAIDFFIRQDNPARKVKQDALLVELFHSFYCVRSIGSGSLSLAWLAQGHFGGYSSWDSPRTNSPILLPGLLSQKRLGLWLGSKALMAPHLFLQFIVTNNYLKDHSWSS